ncbi:HD family hydrolase [Acidiphilium sp.]|uniref:HD family hydrolase n=1 Tax=Acidiphilium sp. TaxID=527 RepID=UPI00258E9F05|nr:HD family hydrolase [Acidiphilium sp.]
MTKPSQRAWIMFRSGSRLNLLDPAPNAWTDADLATGLSRTYRWGGHSCWDLPLSVAQHSLSVLAIRQMLALSPLSPGEALRELLHDGTEALIGGFDPITPLKPHLGEGYLAINRRLQAAVNQRYDLPPWTVASHQLHKHADRLAAASEALHVVGWRRAALRRNLGIMLEPLDQDPLTIPAGMSPWEPWPAHLAADRFEETLRDLLRARREISHAAKNLEYDHPEAAE